MTSQRVTRRMHYTKQIHVKMTATVWELKKKKIKIWMISPRVTRRINLTQQINVKMAAKFS